jgi:hypothetical protein
MGLHMGKLHPYSKISNLGTPGTNTLAYQSRVSVARKKIIRETRHKG